MKYKVPAENHNLSVPSKAEKQEPYYPSVHLPQSMKHVGHFEIGDKVTVTVTGVVKGISMDEWRSEKGEAEVRVSMRTVDIQPDKKNQIEKLDEELDDDE